MGVYSSLRTQQIKWSIEGEGIVILQSVSCPMLCRYLKCSTNGWLPKSILPVIFNVAAFGWCPLKCTDQWSALISSTPSRSARKSKCQYLLLNSPSVTAWSPTSFSFATSSWMVLSSMAFNCLASIVLFANSSLAFLDSQDVKNFLLHHI